MSEEEKYAVLDPYNDVVLADNMSWEMMMAFLRGYRDLYFNERLELKIVQIRKDEK